MNIVAFHLIPLPRSLIIVSLVIPSLRLSPILESLFHLYGANRAREHITAAISGSCGPMSKEDVESAREVTAIGSKELSKVWIGDVGSHVPRIEMVSEIKAHYRKSHSIFLCQ